MRRDQRRIGWVVAAMLLAGAGAVADSKAAKAALKQVDKAAKGVRGIVAEVEYAEIVGKQSIEGSGTLWVDFDGYVRADVAGNSPRQVLFVPPMLYLHRVDEKVVEVYNVTNNPHMLGQYLLVGFAPGGSKMTKRFDVGLVGNEKLDDRVVFNFLLTPKGKDRVLGQAIARIQLWVDSESGLPAQHKIFHAAGEAQLAIRYVSVSRQDELPVTLFQPKWPPGTQTVRK